MTRAAMYLAAAICIAAPALAAAQSSDGRNSVRTAGEPTVKVVTDVRPSRGRNATPRSAAPEIVVAEGCGSQGRNLARGAEAPVCATEI